MPSDDDYMRRALYLATRGRGSAEPNPSVGCVIVKDGRVIGEGHTQPFGGPHAEPTALAHCTERPAGATAYVTLEPCCHTNKKTPPCTPRLIEAGIRRVVVGSLDPNPDVNGKGVALLRAAGVRVDGPLLEAEAKQQIAPFIARTVHARPYVTLKWAQTADGRIAGPGGARLQISNATSSREVHRLRARSDAILVGVNTAIVDDPILTTRDVDNPRPLLRAVVDSDLRLPPRSRLAASANQGAVLVYAGDCGFQEAFNRLDELRAAGVTVIPLPMRDGDRPSLEYVARDLGGRGVTHLLVEPGPTLAAGFFRDNLCDRLWVLRSPKEVNDSTAPAAAPFPSHFVETGRLDIDGDTLIEYLNPHSPIFFAAVPSADFLLAGESMSGASRPV